MGKLDIDRDLIRELAALLEETGLGEIEIEDDGRRIRVVRPATIVAPAATSVAPGTAEATAATAAADLSAHPGAVTSPMVGTVYHAPEPGAEAFVKVGDAVRQGQTLLVIEAMKTFNDIAAPRDGTISQILVENASPVEYGQVLAIIE